MSIPIQDEPESTVGRKPPPKSEQEAEGEGTERRRSGAVRDEPEGGSGAPRTEPGGDSGRSTPPLVE